MCCPACALSVTGVLQADAFHKSLLHRVHRMSPSGEKPGNNRKMPSWPQLDHFFASPKGHWKLAGRSCESD